MHKNYASLNRPAAMRYTRKQIKLAHSMRSKTSKPWEQIANEYNFGCGSTCRRCVLKLIQKGILAPLPVIKSKGELAYCLRSEGESWEVIKVYMGHKNSPTTRWLARCWAGKNNHPWPVP